MVLVYEDIDESVLYNILPLEGYSIISTVLALLQSRMLSKLGTDATPPGTQYITTYEQLPEDYITQLVDLLKKLDIRSQFCKALMYSDIEKYINLCTYIERMPNDAFADWVGTVMRKYEWILKTPRLFSIIVLLLYWSKDASK